MNTYLIAAVAFVGAVYAMTVLAGVVAHLCERGQPVYADDFDLIDDLTEETQP